MALNKPRNTSLPHVNHPKVPTSSSIKRSASDELSMRRNLKHPVIESSQLGDDIEEHVNCPKVPTSSPIKRSGSEELSMRRNLKRPVIESSQLGDDIEEQDAIFKPWGECV